MEMASVISSQSRGIPEGSNGGETPTSKAAHLLLLTAPNGQLTVVPTSAPRAGVVVYMIKV